MYYASYKGLIVFMENVAKQLKILRESVKLSQQKLANLIGIPQSCINRYENGQAEAPYKILLWYADYFDVSMDYIFGRTEKPEGKLYEFKPKIPNEEVRQFVEMCFDEKSPMNKKLKETIIRMLEDGE